MLYSSHIIKYTKEEAEILRISIDFSFFFVVRRIGMTKPPVKLGVGKKFLEKRKEPPSGKMKLVWQPQHFNIGGSMSMNDVKSLSHSKWRCKYHIVFAPKYRRQIIYGQIKAVM